MRVLHEVTQEFLDHRRAIGADRHDEVWDGVLHMPPDPTREHYEIQGALYAWLREHWARRSSRRVLLGGNVSRPGIPDWTKDYRCPDLMLLTGERARRDWEEHFAGGPDVAVEIESPRDGTREKLTFYAEIGCREIWVIGRDSKRVEVFGCVGSAAIAQTPDAEGWLTSVVGVQLRTAGGRVRLRVSGADATD